MSEGVNKLQPTFLLIMKQHEKVPSLHWCHATTTPKTKGWNLHETQHIYMNFYSIGLWCKPMETISFNIADPEGNEYWGNELKGGPCKEPRQMDIMELKYLDGECIVANHVNLQQQEKFNKAYHQQREKKLAL